MARINGVDLPREKRVEIGLTYIFGIGRTTATKICAETGVDPSTRVKDLTEDEVTKIPVRGQRTHTNARTRKGKKRQIGGKKK